MLARLSESAYSRRRAAGSLSEGWHGLSVGRRAALCWWVGADPFSEDTVVGLVLAVGGSLGREGVASGDYSVGHGTGRRRAVVIVRLRRADQ